MIFSDVKHFCQPGGWKAGLLFLLISIIGMVEYAFNDHWNVIICEVPHCSILYPFLGILYISCLLVFAMYAVDTVS
jgi:hypothetical protein